MIKWATDKFKNMRWRTSELFLFIFGVSIYIAALRQAWPNEENQNEFGYYEWIDPGSLIWLGVYVIVICHCLTQAMNLIFSKQPGISDLSFTLRIRMAAIRIVGILALIWFLLEPDRFSSEPDTIAEKFTNKIIFHLYSLRFFIGLLFCITPLLKIDFKIAGKCKWYVAWIPIAFLAGLAIIGISDSNIIQGLVYIAINGMDIGRAPDLFSQNLEVADAPNFGRNRLTFLQRTEPIFATSLLGLFSCIACLRLRQREFKLAFLLASVICYAIVMTQLNWVYSVGIPSLSYSWGYSTTLPTALGICIIATTIFLAGLVACRVLSRDGKPISENLTVAELTKLLLPPWLCFLILFGMLLEYGLYLLTDHAINSNIAPAIYTSYYIPIQFGYYFGIPFMIVVPVALINTILWHNAASRDPSMTVTVETYNYRRTIFPAVFVGIALALTAMAISNFGFANVINSRMDWLSYVTYDLFDESDGVGVSDFVLPCVFLGLLVYLRYRKI